MASKSHIEWTEQTWNPVTGCTKISPGCKHCYAEALAKRLKRMGTPGYQNGFELTLHPERLEQPLNRKKPTTYFVNSMSDLFHQSIPDEFIDQVLGVIKKTPQHTYQILTKRAQRLQQYFRNRQCPSNVWLGVSVEDKKYGVPRIDWLRQVNVSIHFLSIEPLLEDIGSIDLTNIQWVIVGGESGFKARPMKEAWVKNIQQQCENANVAFLFKQWGGWGVDGIKRNKKINGRLFNNRIWDAYPINRQPLLC